jgi:succinate dehydrogenase / fumarate reductase membrane anchor subunit
LSWQTSAGLRSWLLQRLSALYILGFLLFGLVSWLSSSALTYEAWRAWVAHPVVNIALVSALTYEAWRAWVAHPVVNIALVLFFFALLLHMWVGGRDIVMDYVKPLVLRYAALIGFAVCLLAMAIWSLRIVFTATVS